MKKISILYALVLLLTFTSCKNSKETEAETLNIEATDRMISEKQNSEKRIVVTIHPSSNSKVQGEVIFTENNGTVKMHGEFSGLNPEGVHAIHLHEKADCSATDGSSAGGHWNPTDNKHGKWNAADGFHLGDIGNLEVDKDGKASIIFETNEWCIDCNDDRKNIIGRGIIIHKDKDDFTSQPTGNAGNRIGCGEINL